MQMFSRRAGACSCSCSIRICIHLPIIFLLRFRRAGASWGLKALIDLELLLALKGGLQGLATRESEREEERERKRENFINKLITWEEHLE